MSDIEELPPLPPKGMDSSDGPHHLLDEYMGPSGGNPQHMGPPGGQPASLVGGLIDMDPMATRGGGISPTGGHIYEEEPMVRRGMQHQQPDDMKMAYPELEG